MKLSRLWRYKQHFFLGLLILAGVIILLYNNQQHLPDNRGVRMMLRIADPPLRLLAWIDRHAADFYYRVTKTAEVQEDNIQLQRDVILLSNRLDLMQEELRQYRRLGQLLADSPSENYRVLPANVISYHAIPYTRTIKIDRGTRDDVHSYLPVRDRNGLVGEVAEVSERVALVRLVIDSDFYIAAMIKESRLQGYIQGDAATGKCLFQFDNIYQEIETGQTVITSGIAGNQKSVLPKGLPIGRVAGLEKNKSGRLYAVVDPLADFDTLEEVAVLVLPTSE